MESSCAETESNVDSTIASTSETTCVAHLTTHIPQEKPKDIASFVSGEAGHSREVIYDYLINVWKPGKSYRFPKKEEYGKKRSFNYNWLEQYSWLVYSSSLDGAFCLPCVLFARDIGKKGIKLDKLLHTPFNSWTSATRKFKDHELNSDVHKCSQLMASEFKKTMENVSMPVHHQLHEAAVKTMKENRTKLTSIIKTIIFCGKQNLPLRAHRDDSQYYGCKDNTGNFQKLLEFRVDAGDKVLEEHLKKCHKNATYRSKTIQNELISCCGDYICGYIVDDIKSSGFFTVIADEATDSSNIEQLAFVIRYFSERSSEVREEFLAFVECDEGTTGKAVAKLIVEKVNQLGLDMSLCRLVNQC